LLIPVYIKPPNTKEFKLLCYVFNEEDGEKIANSIELAEAEFDVYQSILKIGDDVVEIDCAKIEHEKILIEAAEIYKERNLQ
jgi:hypothetical protein